MCASRIWRRGRARKARQNTTIASVGVLLPILFLSFLPSSMAKAALANASTGIGLLCLGMEHRAKSVATVHNSGLA